MRINEVHSSLRSTYIDWSDLLINPRFIRNGHLIIWENSQPLERYNVITRSYVLNLISRKQYSYQIYDDGSIIQLFYQFENNNRDLKHATLAYYSTGEIEERNEEEVYSDLAPPISSDSPHLFQNQIIEYSPDDPPVPWVRIDYDPPSCRGPLHHTCHMHIGLLQHARIPITRVLSPRQFVEFVMALFYPSYYREHRLDDNWEAVDFEKMRSFNDDCFPHISSQNYEILPFIGIPSP